MNLEYQNLAEWGKLHRKLKNTRSFYWSKPTEDEIAGWRLQMFTVDKDAKAESRRNLTQLKTKAKLIDAPVLIVKGDNVQLVGTDYSIAFTDLMDQTWYDELTRFFDRKNMYYSKPFWVHHESDSDKHTFSLHGYGMDALWARSPETGFYLVEEDRKVTDRREQIQILWDLGYVARRGRPVCVGYERHSGSRAEVALITQQARQMWHRRGHSEVATKVCSTYTSINRYFAWPGSW